MFCPQCGKEIPNESSFCFKCGKSLESTKPFAKGPDEPTVPKLPDKTAPNANRDRKVTGSERQSTQKKAGEPGATVCVSCDSTILAGQGFAVYSEAIEGSSVGLHPVVATSGSVLEKTDNPARLIGAVLYCNSCANSLFTNKRWEEAKALRTEMKPDEIDAPEGSAARSQVIDFSIALRARRRGLDAARSRDEASQLASLWMTDPKAAIKRLKEAGGVAATGQFVGRRVAPLKANGQYRGPGSLEVTEKGLKVAGRHVFPYGWRLAGPLIALGGLLEMFGIISLGAMLTGYLACVVIGLVGWQLWLKEEHLDINFSQITTVAVESTSQLVAVSFSGHQFCSPAVLKSPDFEALAVALRLEVQNIKLRGISKTA